MRHAVAPIIGSLLLATQTGCSIKATALHMIGDLLASEGSTFASDNDPELVKAAAPFSLKLMESLLAKSPRHKSLLLSAARGFAQYSYAFVQQEADQLEDQDVDAAFATRARAKRLYLRARDYGLRGLEVNHRGFSKMLREHPRTAVRDTRIADVPLLYWTAVAWAAAVSQAKDDPQLIGDLPMVQALIDRAFELDENFDHGAIHTFLMTYEMSSRRHPDALARARRHFSRAMALGGDQQAGPLVAWAETVVLPDQDRAAFERLLHRALAINVDARPQWRLINLIHQRRARWLLSQTDALFLPLLVPDQETER